MLAVSTMEATTQVFAGCLYSQVSLAPDALQRLDFVDLQYRNSP